MSSCLPLLEVHDDDDEDDKEIMIIMIMIMIITSRCVALYITKVSSLYAQ